MGIEDCIDWHDGSVAFDCRRCSGTGIDPVRIGHDPTWCDACGGIGQEYVDLLAFARNLAVGAGLCLADDNGYTRCVVQRDLGPGGWRPGCQRPAPTHAIEREEAE